MGNDANSGGAGRDAVSGRYVSLLLRFRVADDGTIARVTIENVRTQARVTLDLSTLVAFLRAAFAPSGAEAGPDDDTATG